MTKSHANSVPTSRRRAFRAPSFLLLAALLLALGALLGTSGEARAQATETTVVAVSNQDQEHDGDRSMHMPFAQGFTTGIDTDGYTMTAIEVEFASGTSQANNLSVQLRPAANGGGPAAASAKIADFTKPDNLGSAGDKTFTLPANTKLAANTEYFVFFVFSGSVSDGPRAEAHGFGRRGQRRPVGLEHGRRALPARRRQLGEPTTTPSSSRSASSRRGKPPSAPSA